MAQLVFFGKLQDLAGGRDRTLCLPDGVATAGGLVHYLAGNEPVLADAINSDGVRIVVNEAFADFDAAITDQDEIAFLPPVSGG